MLIVLGALVLGGVSGSLLRIEGRLEGFGDLLPALLFAPVLTQIVITLR